MNIEDHFTLHNDEENALTREEITEDDQNALMAELDNMIKFDEDEEVLDDD